MPAVQPAGGATAERFASLCARLRLPLVAAPMFRVSGPELVAAACAAGVVGAFPTVNCRTPAELDAWLVAIERRASQDAARNGAAVAPWCANLIVHRSNPRLHDDLAVLLAHRPALVITSVGAPTPVISPLHDIGALVFADVASMQHAHKAAAAGADGLVLLTAGAGGQTGWLNPLAFVRAVRAFFDGPLVLAGGIADGHALFAARALGCDLAYMGTRFIVTQESLASDAYRAMLVACSADDVLLTKAFTGLETNMLRPSIVAAGLDPDALPARGPIDIAQDISLEANDSRAKRWKDIWSAGHSVGGVSAVTSAAEVVAQTEVEYRQARARWIDGST